jgi:uncharacterized RDD family membrane protein YckC
MLRAKLLRKRLTAVGFDALLLIISSAAITIVCDIGLGWAKPDSPIWLTPLALQLGLLLFFSIDGGLQRATIGFRVTGLVFKAHSGSPLSQTHAMVRVAVGLVTVPIFPISIILTLPFTKRSLADLICRTYVCEGTFQQMAARGFEPITRPVE